MASDPVVIEGYPGDHRRREGLQPAARRVLQVRGVMPDAKKTDDGSHLTIDWRVNIGWMLGLAAQTIVFVFGATWYASKMDSRIEYVEKRVLDAEGRIATADREARDINSRLIRLEEKSVSMLEILRAIQAQLGPQRRTDIDAR